MRVFHVQSCNAREEQNVFVSYHQTSSSMETGDKTKLWDYYLFFFKCINYNMKAV